MGWPSSVLRYAATVLAMLVMAGPSDFLTILSDCNSLDTAPTLYFFNYVSYLGHILIYIIRIHIYIYDIITKFYTYFYPIVTEWGQYASNSSFNGLKPLD